jgi:transposase
MGTFLRCMDRALKFFGGSTATDIFDNMKTVVLSHTAHATVFNPRFLAYAHARGGIAVVACNVRRGNEKGRVERPIGYVRLRFWPGRRFRDLFDLNAQAAALARRLRQRACARGDRPSSPLWSISHDEKPKLKPLSDDSLQYRRCRGHWRKQDVSR